MSNTPKLPLLRFDHFFCYDELMEFLKSLAEARPRLVQLSALGTSREGREIPMLTITDMGTGPAEDKPAYLIHGNIHACELSGTHAALYTARQLVADYAKSSLLKRVAFYIIPRINPDWAEFVVTTSGSVRSRTDRSIREANTLYQQDVNGDGLILTMRQEHPDGQFVADPKEPRLMTRRTRDSKGPFYRTLPEGMIYKWDGTDNIRIEGRMFDWNRNWSYDWRPEPEQSGAGDFPFSEPEMRALAEFIHSHPNIFGLLGYHNGPAGVLRPPSTGADTDLDQADVRIMEELAQIGAKYTGFPVFSVIKYHRVGHRDVNLRGHFHNFGYHHLGLFVFEFELGMLLNSAGIKTEQILGVKNDEEYQALMRHLMKWWDRQKKRDRIYEPWKPFDHPQLGRVEIGGTLNRHMAGPTLAHLKKISAGTYKFTVEHALRHPSVTIEETTADALGGNVYRIRARVANRGQFPTHISNKGRTLKRLRPVRVDLNLSPGVKLLSRQGHMELGHLNGLTDSRLLEWFVKAPGRSALLCEIRVWGGTGGNALLPVRRPKH